MIKNPSSLLDSLSQRRNDRVCQSIQPNTKFIELPPLFWVFCSKRAHPFRRFGFTDSNIIRIEMGFDRSNVFCDLFIEEIEVLPRFIDVKSDFRVQYLHFKNVLIFRCQKRVYFLGGRRGEVGHELEGSSKSKINAKLVTLDGSLVNRSVKVNLSHGTAVSQRSADQCDAGGHKGLPILQPESIRIAPNRKCDGAGADKHRGSRDPGPFWFSHPAKFGQPFVVVERDA